MPHKIEPSDSNPSSRGSSNERLHIGDSTDPNRRPTPKVVVHNGGGKSYDEKRPASWDKNRWK